MRMAWCVAMMLFLAYAASASELTEDALRAGLERADTRYRGLKKRMTPEALAKAVTKPDRRGKIPGDDDRANVLLPAAVTFIDSTRQKLEQELATGDRSAATATLQAYAAAIDKEVATFNNIRVYWRRQADAVPDHEPYGAYLKKNGIEMRSADEIQLLESRFDSQIDSGEFTAAVTGTLAQLTALRKQAAQEQHALVRDAMATKGIDGFLAKDRPSRCPPGAKKTSGTEKPTIAGQNSRAQGKEYYPVQSKRLAEQGIVYASVWINENGCVSRAAITVSSGFPRLDAATLEMAFDIDYLPAEKDGKAAAADLTFKMVWKLQ